MGTESKNNIETANKLRRCFKPSLVTSFFYHPQQPTLVAQCWFHNTKFIAITSNATQQKKRARVAIPVPVSKKMMIHHYSSPSGKLTLLLNMAIEIVDLPIKHGEFPYLCKRLPEGSSDGHLNGGLIPLD